MTEHFLELGNCCRERRMIFKSVKLHLFNFAMCSDRKWTREKKRKKRTVGRDRDKGARGEGGGNRKRGIGAQKEGGKQIRERKKKISLQQRNRLLLHYHSTITPLNIISNSSGTGRNPQNASKLVIAIAISGLWFASG